MTKDRARNRILLAVGSAIVALRGGLETAQDAELFDEATDIEDLLSDLIDFNNSLEQL